MLRIELAIVLLSVLWAYVCYLLIFGNRKSFKSRLSRLLEDDELGNIVRRWGISPQRYRYIRVCIVFAPMAGAILQLAASGKVQPPFFLCAVLFYLLTTSSGLKLMERWWLKLSHTELRRDGELIAFARMYELEPGQTLAAFCRAVSPYFPKIGNDLVMFSQRLTVDGKMAYSWFRLRFPANHPFADKLILGLQAAESGAKAEMSSLLDQIAQDHFAAKKKTFAPLVNAMTMIPSILVVVMMLVILFKYFAIVKSSLFMM